MKTYTFDSLKNYALWYYFKYFVSPKKLMQKLKEKSKDIAEKQETPAARAAREAAKKGAKAAKAAVAK